METEYFFFSIFSVLFSTCKLRIKISLNHKCRVSYQVQIIADPEPSINLLYDCETRKRSKQIAVSGWKWLILTLFFTNSACWHRTYTLLMYRCAFN